MIPLGGFTGRIILSSTGRFGVRPDEFASAGPDDSPLLACVDPGDEETEFTWVIRSLPSSGTLTANDDGGMSHVGAADGSYVVPFGLYTWAPGGPGVYEGDASFTTTFGAVILATETDAALALSAVQSRAAGLAVETDQAFALEASAPGGVGVAVEADAAFALPGLQRRAVGLAVETDEAFALNVGTGGGAGATAAEIWNYVLADGRTAAETLLDNARMMRIILAGISGKTAGLGSDTETYFGEDGTTPRIVASFDSQGNRVSVTTDGAP